MSGIFPGISDTAEETFRALFKRLNENNILTTFDPNLRPLWKSHDYMVKTINELAGYADIVLPGVEEGKILMGSDDPEAIADFYLKGERTNTVGAGDGFALGVITALLEGKSLRSAVMRGNAVGALQIQTPGDNDGYPTPDEPKAFYTQEGVAED